MGLGNAASGPPGPGPSSLPWVTVMASLPAGPPIPPLTTQHSGRTEPVKAEVGLQHHPRQRPPGSTSPSALQARPPPPHSPSCYPFGPRGLLAALSRTGQARSRPWHLLLPLPECSSPTSSQPRLQVFIPTSPQGGPPGAPSLKPRPSHSRSCAVPSIGTSPPNAPRVFLPPPQGGPSTLVTVLLVYRLQAIKSILRFKTYSRMVYVCLQLCNHHKDLTLEHFCHPISSHSPFLSPPS